MCYRKCSLRVKNSIAYNFEDNVIPGEVGDRNTYWRDVGTIEAYYEATLDLRDVVPRFNLFNDDWPIGTAAQDLPPSKFVHDEEGRRGEAVGSLIAEGCIISGAKVKGSVLGRHVHVHSYSRCLGLHPYGQRRDWRKRGIARCHHRQKCPRSSGRKDRHLTAKKDAERFFVSESGIVVIPKQPDSDGRVDSLQF